MTEKDQPGNQADVLEQWKTIVGIQMHFNDMIIRTRTLGITVVVALYGAAAASIGQYPNQYIHLGRDIHISLIGIVLGLLLLSSVFIVDRWYYYTLLLGTVERAQELEKLLVPIRVGDNEETAGVATYLTARVGRKRAALLIMSFYGLVFTCGVAFLVYILSAYQPITR